MILQVVGILVILFYFFVAFMCSKSWRITHVLFTFFVFGAAIAFCFYASISLKTRSAWTKHYQDLVKQNAKVKEEAVLLQHGDFLQVVQTSDTVHSVKEELYRAMLDRGRVWRGCAPQGALGADGSITLGTVPAGTPEGLIKPNGIKDEKILLYGFAEQELPGKPFKVPTVYLGEFQTTTVTDTTVSLKALSLPLSPDQLAAINAGASWVLYELLPLDGHHFFSDTQPDDKHEFGTMEAKNLQAWFPKPASVTDKFHERIMTTYLQDGRPIPDVERDAPGFSPIPDELWIKVEFLKGAEVDVDSNAEQGALLGGFFDTQGRTLTSRLRQADGQPVKFNIGDTAILHSESKEVQNLLANGTCKNIHPVFVRKLNDYEEAYKLVQKRTEEVVDDTRNASRNLALVQETVVKAQIKVDFREDEKAKLEKDVLGFTREIKEATQLADTLEQRWSLLRNRINELHAQNVALYKELAELQFKLAAEINQRTAAEAAAAP